VPARQGSPRDRKSSSSPEAAVGQSLAPAFFTERQRRCWQADAVAASTTPALGCYWSPKRSQARRTHERRTRSQVG
jgi:hypothetical protein